MKIKHFFLFIFLIFVFPDYLLAQTSSSTSTTEVSPIVFPQWAKSLRRAEIIALGSFPFAYFISNFGFDVYRSAMNGWDRRYAPWPITSSSMVIQTQDEKKKVLWIAAGGAVLVSIIDFAIEQFKRHRRQREINELPAGTPIIIQKPLQESGSAESSQNSETGTP